MGRLQAEEMVEHLRQDIALQWHLQSNHYPPVPAEMIPIAGQAIDAANECDSHRIIELPDGVSYRDGRTAVEAYVIIESFHLQPFIEDLN